jgi:hypothetical protein
MYLFRFFIYWIYPAKSFVLFINPSIAIYYHWFSIFIDSIVFIPVKIYTSEDLKWDAPEGVILNRYWYLTLDELKWDILILQGFKMGRPMGRHFKSLLVSDPLRIKMSHFNSSRV